MNNKQALLFDMAHDFELREEIRNKVSKARYKRAIREAKLEAEAARSRRPPKTEFVPTSAGYVVNRAQALAMLTLTFNYDNLEIVVVGQDNYDALIIEGRDGKAGDAQMRFKLGLRGGYTSLADSLKPPDSHDSHDRTPY